MRAVILAGGKGTRLRPYTTVLPKPLVPVAERPILELIIRQLAASGFKRITLSVGHLGGLIKAYMDHVELPDLELDYVWEDEPLGTAGALRLVEDLDEPFLAMNGDVLTTMDYGELVRFHTDHDAPLTIATFQKDVGIDLGVIRGDGSGYVTDYVEKPTMHFDVSMGIYVYDPEVLELIPDGRFDFPDVVNAMIEKNRKVMSYKGPGVWFDIGTVGEHERATAAIADNPELFADA